MTELSEDAKSLELWMKFHKFPEKIAKQSYLQQDLDNLVYEAIGLGIKWPHGLMGALAELNFTCSRNEEGTSLKSITPIAKSNVSRQYNSRPRKGVNTEQDTDGGFGRRKK